MRLEERVGDEMVAAEREELGAGCDNGGGLPFDRGGNVGRPAIVEGAIAVVDDGERRERIEAERILRVAVEDRRGPPDRLRPEARARPVGGRRVEGDAPHHRIDPGKLARIAPPHERQGAAIGRLEAAAPQRAEEGIVGRTRLVRVNHGGVRV